jgi:hypothetical protein
MNQFSDQHLLYLRDQFVQLPDAITQKWRKVSYLVTQKDTAQNQSPSTYTLGSIPILSGLILNRTLHTLHHTDPVNVIYASDTNKTHTLGRQIAKKFGLPLLLEFAHTPEAGVSLNAPVIGILIHESEHQSKTSQTPAVILPTFIANSRYWRPAGYKQAITKCLISVDRHQQEKFAAILELVIGICERHRYLECTLCLPESLTKLIPASLPSNCVIAITPTTTADFATLIHDHHVVISCSSLEHALMETALTIAAGIPLIALENECTKILNQPQPVIESVAMHPPHIFGTIAGILTHPEIAYQQAKNTQHWLKTNLSETFLPTAWLSAVSWIMTTAGFETIPSSTPILDPEPPEVETKVTESLS